MLLRTGCPLTMFPIRIIYPGSFPSDSDVNSNQGIAAFKREARFKTRVEAYDIDKDVSTLPDGNELIRMSPDLEASDSEASRSVLPVQNGLMSPPASQTPKTTS
jgi:hypothetical protein